MKHCNLYYCSMITFKLPHLDLMACKLPTFFSHQMQGRNISKLKYTSMDNSDHVLFINNYILNARINFSEVIFINKKPKNPISCKILPGNIDANVAYIYEYEHSVWDNYHAGPSCPLLLLCAALTRPSLPIPTIKLRLR